MELIQAEFQRPFPPPGVGKHVKVVLVEKSWNLKVGDVVSFKGEGDGNPWTTTFVYKTVLETNDIHTKWGLDLPRSERTER